MGRIEGGEMTVLMMSAVENLYRVPGRECIFIPRAWAPRAGAWASGLGHSEGGRRRDDSLHYRTIPY